ncbi:MAG: T9SS type A sorting domain-containing protein [Saprospiraceae bacterium]|nr:T9SS type A sorting domain-containing protein [Candidatus Defluviibacterium haderslevense]
MNFSIFNQVGENLMNGKLESNNINISNLSPGNYFIKLHHDNYTSTLKFFKIK